MTTKLKKIIIIILIILISILCFKFLPQDKIKEIVVSSGSLAPVVYILLFSILPIFFFPVPILALAGGIAFGLIDGTIYTLIGASINCILMFFLARYTARDFVINIIKRKFSIDIQLKMDSTKSYEQFLIVFILRLIPLVPYNVINYGSGLTKMSFKNYISASILGIIPGTVVFLNIGDKSSNVNSSGFYISLILMVILVVFSTYGAKIYNKKRKDNIKC